MGTSPVDERRGREEETFHLYNSPCYLFRQVIEACLKCLGHDRSTAEPAASYPPSQTQNEMKTNEEYPAVDSRAKAIALFRRPKSPPIRGGGGGHIHSSDA